MKVEKLKIYLIIEKKKINFKKMRKKMFFFYLKIF